ncbi:hypothetical protein [Cyanobacterium aponinum]|uniref:Uncharacterized protein n=1 Tax=Cyanobacterium aponinum (strain PCC 10605) TaxID=755178 RepID=K9Z4A2_CYAAP|nr:hypothetical protein [Cyanobacterium aponinum]AFZ54021.1 hypothetical protein Cyan10605_1925 [Cyanobacterium aponinum PCC 10605]
MSEYQYYEFQTLDQPLTKQQQQKISQLSSRVRLNSRKAIFTYSYGDFPANEDQILADYFDALFYIANWGTVKLMFRFPISLVNINELKKYTYDDFITIDKIGSYLILKIEINDEERSDWIEEDNSYLDDLIELRQQILAQDYRVLYLAWLKAIELSKLYDDAPLKDIPEPPIPHGLNQLSESLKIFVELFEVNQNLIKVGATNSSKITPIPDNIFLENISKLSNIEKDDFLSRLLQEEPNLSLKLKQKLLELSELTNNKTTIEKRTIKQLFTEAEKIAQSEEKRQKEEARQKKIKELKAFANQENQAWLNVDNLIQKSNPKAYDEAKMILIKLKELAIYQGKEVEFYHKLEDIKQKYSRRPTFIARLNNL